jgi:hypothetical protein
LGDEGFDGVDDFLEPVCLEKGLALDPPDGGAAGFVVEDDACEGFAGRVSSAGERQFGDVEQPFGIVVGQEVAPGGVEGFLAGRFGRHAHAWFRLGSPRSRGGSVAGSLVVASYRLEEAFNGQPFHRDEELGLFQRYRQEFLEARWFSGFTGRSAAFAGFLMARIDDLQEAAFLERRTDSQYQLSPKAEEVLNLFDLFTNSVAYK